MARFAGTKKEHHESAADFARRSRSSLNMFRAALAEGDCETALASLGELSARWGMYAVHRRASKGRGNFGGGRKPIHKFQNQFAKKCLRK